MLAVPVSWLHACLGTCWGWQLPPLEHAILQTCSVGILLRRAPLGAPCSVACSLVVACSARRLGWLPASACMFAPATVRLQPPTAAVCKQFVSLHPAHARVVGAAYWLLQQATALLCLGSRQHLETAAEGSSECQQCVAVVWALQVRGQACT